MKDKHLLERITVNPNIMVGKPVIKGTRITVEYVLGRLAHGTKMDELIKEYDGLSHDDIHACLLFATKSLGDTEFMSLVEEMA